MSKEKKRLGEGVGALFSEPPSRKTEQPIETAHGISQDYLARAIREVDKKDPVVSLWSRQAKVLFRYLSLTKLGFRESTDASEVLEAGLEKKYPELWAAVNQQLQLER